MREHTRAELARKLQPHLTDGDDLPALLDALQAQGWLSDARAAQSLVHRRAARMGNSRLEAELRARGVDDALIAQALETGAGTEWLRALELWRRKFGVPPADVREQARQMRYLMSRGFAAEMVRSLWKQAGAGGLDDEGGPLA